MILACHDVSKAFGEHVIIQNGSFHIEDHEKAALVGINGAGKSTLLKMIVGDLTADGGTITLTKGKTLGYLSQHQELVSGNTIYEEVRSAKADVIAMETRIREIEKELKDLTGDELESRLNTYHNLTSAFELANGYSYESEIVGVLKGLGFTEDEFDKPVDTLSGGQKTRVSLSKLLLTRPDILLLDEPTNHLDLSAIRWLENFLLDFENTVIVVSHDRHFLNKVCTHICDVDFGKIQMYVGNYDFWYEYTQMRQRQARDQNKKNEQKIKELQAFIARFSANAAKSKQATSRKKQLDALEMIDMPVSSRRFPFVDFKPDRECGNDLLRVDHLTKTIGDRKVLDDISFVIHPREKVAFVGADAMAKTTLFKIIMGEMEPDEGEYKWGVTTTQSYFPSDNSAYFDGVDLTLIDWLRQYTTQTLETDIRSWLGRMLFSGDEALKKANVLSGGERVRCMLCKMMLSGANVLVLDEPTNHLDLESITALNDGLIRYPETILFTSHDHQFVQTVADRIIEVSGNTLLDRKGTYDEFLADFDEDQLKKY